MIVIGLPTIGHDGTTVVGPGGATLGDFVQKCEDEVVANNACPRCKTPAGELCHGPKGRKVKKAHGERYGAEMARSLRAGETTYAMDGLAEILAQAGIK
jgi:hypothetical protein